MSISSPVHVGDSPVSLDNSATITLTGVSLAAGEMIHVWVNGHSGGNTTLPTISATGLSFTNIFATNRFGDFQAWWWAVADSTFSGDITVTATSGSSMSLRLIGVKISGQSASPIAEYVTSQFGVSSTTPSISLADCASDSLVLAMCCNSSGAGTGPTTGHYTDHTLTEIANVDLTNGANPHMEIQYSYNVTTAGWIAGSTGTHHPEIVEIAAGAGNSSSITVTTTVSGTAKGIKYDDGTISSAATLYASYSGATKWIDNQNVRGIARGIMRGIGV